MRRLKWIDHDDLAIRITPSVGRREFLDHLTFRGNGRPLFTEIFGPMVGLKEEWELPRQRWTSRPSATALKPAAASP